MAETKFSVCKHCNDFVKLEFIDEKWICSKCNKVQ